MPKLTLKQSKKITISTDGQVLATTSKKTKYGSVTTIHRIHKPSQQMLKTIEKSYETNDDNIFSMLESSTKIKAIEAFNPKITNIIKPRQITSSDVSDIIDLTQF